MKKVLCGLVIALMMIGNVDAEKFSNGTGNLRILEERFSARGSFLQLETYCIHGTIFVTFYDFDSNLSSNQIFINQNGKSLPKEC
jgi:hypothetical protein